MGKSKKKELVVNKRPYRIQILVSAFHGLWLLVFTFFWLNQPFTYGDEMTLIQLTSGIKHYLFPMLVQVSDLNQRLEKPDKKDFLFVNVSYDRELIEKKKDGLPVGKTDITDRKKLARFFNILNQKPDNHKFVLCDIFFKDISPDDTILLNEMEKMKNLLIPYHKQSGQWEMPIFDVDKGMADYITGDANGTFLKFGLTEGDHKTIPLIMYEKLNNARFEKKAGLFFSDGKLSLNSIVLDFRIQPRDLEKGGDYNPFYINLGEMLILPDKAVLDLVKNRIVVIGDYEDRDIHETVIGDMPGSLLLLNVYLALVNGDHQISFLFVIFLFAAYTFISYQIFFGNRIEEREWLVRIIQSVIKGKLITKLANYLLIMGAFSVFMYFFFNIHINIMVIAFYLTFLERTVKIFKQKQGIQK